MPILESLWLKTPTEEEIAQGITQLTPNNHHFWAPTPQEMAWDINRFVKDSTVANADWWASFNRPLVMGFCSLGSNPHQWRLRLFLADVGQGRNYDENLLILFGNPLPPKYVQVFPWTLGTVLGGPPQKRKDYLDPNRRLVLADACLDAGLLKEADEQKRMAAVLK